MVKAEVYTEDFQIFLFSDGTHSGQFRGKEMIRGQVLYLFPLP